jgi:hypothetical protein
MKYKFEVFVAVEGLLPAVKEVLDSVNKTMESFTGMSGKLTARGRLGETIVTSNRALLPVEIEAFRKASENIFNEKYPEWKAEVKFVGEV